MTRILFARVVLFATVISVSACGSDTTERMDLATAHTWRISESWRAGIEDPTDYSNFRIKLNKDGTYATTEVDATNRSGTWSFNGDETHAILVDDANGAVLDFAILRLEEDLLKVNFTLIVLFEWTLVPV
jgi:hypothetical protein